MAWHEKFETLWFSRRQFPRKNEAVVKNKDERLCGFLRASWSGFKVKDYFLKVWN